MSEITKSKLILGFSLHFATSDKKKKIQVTLLRAGNGVGLKAPG